MSKDIKVHGLAVGGTKMCEMRYTKDDKINHLTCNKCGKAIEKVNPRNYQDHLCIKKKWNYFSQKDLTTHSMIICEACYDEWIQSFAIPVKETQVVEIFECVDEY